MPKFFPSSLRDGVAQLAVAAALASMGAVRGVAADAPTAPAVRLEEGNGWRWLRGNMHTHSHWSDGNDYLEMIALWYRDHGYQFLVFTDHNVFADEVRWINVRESKGGVEAFEKLCAAMPQRVDRRTSESGELEVRLQTFAEVSKQFYDPEKFLLIQGEEISDEFGPAPVHLCAANLAEVIPPMSGGSVAEVIQNNVRAVIKQRERTGQPMIVHLNHPNFRYGVTAEDLMRVSEERFFEVYNGHTGVHNSGDATHAGTERMWDVMLTQRLAILDMPLVYGLAVDDSHDYHAIPSREANPGRGWVMVLAQHLAPADLIASLEAGRFYSSSGVALRRIDVSADAYIIEAEPQDGVEYRIDFIGTRRGFDPSSEAVVDAEGKPVAATRRYSSDVGATLASVMGTSATYRFRGDEIYVRARATSSRRHANPSEPDDPECAWCQPVLGPGMKEQGAESSK